jgi:GTP cyclohydrolase IA
MGWAFGLAVADALSGDIDGGGSLDSAVAASRLRRLYYSRGGLRFRCGCIEATGVVVTCGEAWGVACDNVRPGHHQHHPMTAQTASSFPVPDTAARVSAQRDIDAMPASERVRHRIKASGKRFHANDNISEFIRDGELPELQTEVEGKLREVLKSLVIDTESDHNTQDTAQRVAKMYLNEVFRGRYVPPPPVTEFPNVEHLNELMIVGPITIRSACSHHFCPIMGRVWIGVMPNQHSNLIGLSKYARLAEWVMSRPQIQEEAVSQLANLLQSKIQPDGLALVMEADHFCMHWRGVKDIDAKMINSVMRGSFLKDPNLRREFLALIDSRKA